MALISVSMVDANTYQVVVEGADETEYRVVMDPDYYKRLSRGEFTHEWVLVQAFRVLLERDANVSIPAEFDLKEFIAGDIEIESKIASRLAP
ncbi:MAG: hypothetical protein CMD56_04865 [Gammaproteobacteria bacterium]|jgi:hypothetical protein|nr:hypothetical protein [Gammaproteobacteria bacterium]|tara:strand:- start:41 stop:316 length:276 start_codon:yes stop_codon:yes gene_type:complete